MNRKLIVNLDSDQNQDLSAVNMITLKNKIAPKTDKSYVDGFLKKSGGTMTGEINMSRKKITNQVHPSQFRDVTTKQYVDTNFVNVAGSTILLGNTNMGGHKVINLKAPTANSDATTKNYVETNYLSRSGGILTGDLILPRNSYPVQGNTNKAISYESQREIFLSGYESFPMQSAIDMHDNIIRNVATPTSSHQAKNKGYCDFNFLNRRKGGVIMGSLSMNRNDLNDLPDTPKFGGSSAVNKNYVDDEISKIPSGFIKKSGDTMSGDLDMDGNFVRNVGIDLSDNTAAMPKSYIDALPTNVISYPITADIDMNNHKITNLKSPSANTDAVNKDYLDEQLLKSHLLPSHHVNAFKYLLDVDESSSEANITSVSTADFSGSPHKYKKAYSVTFVKNSESNIYQSTLGINIYPLNVGNIQLSWNISGQKTQILLCLAECPIPRVQR